MRTDTEILIKALRVLSADIQTDDGVANSVIAEAAFRLEELEKNEYICNKCGVRQSDACGEPRFRKSEGLTPCEEDVFRSLVLKKFKDRDDIVRMLIEADK